MPKFVIERDIPEAGRLSSEELQAISQKSCGVLREMGAQIQWVQSYVTDDKIYCVYIAPDEETVRKHAAMGGTRDVCRGTAGSEGGERAAGRESEDVVRGERHES